MTVHARVHATSEAAAVPVRVLQRACACGEGADVSGKCPACAAEERLGVRPKLTINRPGDRWEREADRIADQVVSDRPPARAGPLPVTPLVQRQEVDEEEEDEELQRKAASPGAGKAAGGAQAAAAALSSGGRPLSAGERAYFEPRFGRDLSAVRIHEGARAGAAARAINARAYTLGNAIAFAPSAYAPGTPAGRRLMAHELTHTIQQQTSNPRIRAQASHNSGLGSAHELSIQRQLSCSIDHVEHECDNADAMCHAIQDKYCKKKYPGASEIATLHANAVAGAEAKKGNIPHAAENLLHFLGASGSEKVMPTGIFEKHRATKDQIKDVHRERFIEGATKRLKDGRLAAGGSAEMVWTDTANAFNFTEDDLGLAVGGYTLCSKVKVSATAKGGSDVEVSFDSWTVQAFDCYNWDPGKGIGLFGGVSDNDLCCLQNAGKGKHFRIRTDPWSNTHANGSFTISKAAPPPKSKSKPPSKSEGSR